MKIPWAAVSGDFPSKHLELQVKGVTRFCIWQATHGDGDFIRFSTDKAWHSPGEHAHGYAGSATNLFEAIGGDLEDLVQYVLTDRTLVVLDSHFETIPIKPKPLEPASTFIKRLENRTTLPLTLFSTESQQTIFAGPGATVPLDMAVPWAISDSGLFGFPGRHLEVSLGGIKRFWIWQHDHRNDGDYVRVSTNGTWSPFNNRVKGFAETGECPGDLVFTNGRTLIVSSSEVEVRPHPLLLDQLFNLAQPFLHPVHRVREDPLPLPIPSVPRRSAVAFSMAGPVSDAFLRGERKTRFVYKETGKRYEFKLGSDGRVTATHPDGTTTILDKARSFTRSRKGEVIAPPAFDLIAANGGRVFAKAAGKDDFYFATMDHFFIQAPFGAPDDANEISIPGTYFKLDPEFGQQGQNPLDLLETTKGITLFEGPAAERLPVFHRVLQRQINDMMIADVKPREWLQLDCRPPQNVLALAVRDLTPVAMGVFAGLLARAPAVALPLGILFSLYTLVQGETPFETMFNLPNTQTAPPVTIPATPTYTPVTYARDGDPNLIQPRAISFNKVLDIGVGNIHHHQQYQRITGCEMQANLDIPFYAECYSFFNGALTDGDGYCDGTINYYALVKHANGFALLFQDEQAYFSQRWRLVGPDDNGGALFSLIGDLPNQSGYRWNRDKYWSPFDGPQHITEQSRLAVSAQVLLVTGVDPAAHTWKIYSINFSWGTMDRTWRWRNMPSVQQDGVLLFDDTAIAAGNEPIAAGGTTVYPQTIRLRDDMTINLKGTREGTVGRWYQRYLPADNKLMPPEERLIAGRQMPAEHYDHTWKFLPEPLFQLADKFQFFGVYDGGVDTRVQYYDVTPAAGEEAKLAASPGPWVDDARQLYVSQWKFNWKDPDRLGASPVEPPSIFNAETRLQIVKKGSRWIAMLWDKRDDDMKPFDRLPMQVTLKRRGPDGTFVKEPDGTILTATVTIGANHTLRQPPMVKTAYFWLEPNGMAGIAFEASSFAALRENVSRVRMASLEAVPAPVPDEPARVVSRVNPLFDKTTEGNFTPVIGPGTCEFRWTPTATERELLQQHCSNSGETQFATSIWFEDIIGNVAPPERILWQRSPMMKGVATPSMIPLGVPTQVTVRVSDSRTGLAIPDVVGVVWADGKAVGTTDVPFTFTFNTHVETEFDPESHLTTTTVVNPIMTITLPQYPDAAVPVTFFTPKLDVRLEPASVPIGPTVQVVVRAEDSMTHAPVQGRVIIGGVDVGATNTPFNFAFGPASISGGVSATGYPSKSFSILLFTPEMQVSVSPSPIPTGIPVQVTVRAVDKRTGLPVNGRVKLNSVDTAPTNTPFMFTFGLTPPSGVVSAQFYADVPIVWPPLFVSTMQTSISPKPVPINKTVQVTVTAKNAQTGGLVAGRVKIGITDVGPTNTPFSTIFKPKVVGSEQELVMPPVTVSAPGYQDTLVDTGF